MKKKTKKATPKKKVATKKKTSITENEVIIRVLAPEQSQIPVIRQSELGPEQEHGKYSLAKSWVSEKQIIRIVQNTPSQYIFKRKGRGGMEFDYIPGWYVKKVLNFTFAWNWDFRILKQEMVGAGTDWAQVITTGELTVKDDHGHTIVKTDNGKADVKFLKGTSKPMDIGNDYKASATDCLKRCAVQLGIASDVYGKSEFREEVGIEVKNDPSHVYTSNTVKPATKSFPAPKMGKIELQKGQVIGPDGEAIWACDNCGDPISDQEKQFSERVHKKSLCRDCQKNTKK